MGNMKQFYRVIKKADNKPLESNGKEIHYTRGEALKKSKMFDGKIEPLSDEENDLELLKEAFVNLKFAFAEVLAYAGHEKVYNDKYPFNKNFREMADAVIEWTDSETDEPHEPNEHLHDLYELTN
jgi:hypothetical protein